VDFLWSEQDCAFRVLKDRLTKLAVLTMFDPNAEVTELHTDNSSLGLGAMLLQSKKIGDSLKLVYCVSKKTSDCESKYHSSKLELMCVVWAMSKSRQFLLGLQIVVYTDRSLMTCSEGGKDWDEILTEVQNSINNSESKVSTRTPFEMLHGYRPRFHQGVLRELSKTVDDWEPPEWVREAVRERLEKKDKDKAMYDRRRHDNTHYTNGEVVVMKSVPMVTGESTKLQDRYRGPLVIIEVLPGDVYRVAELDKLKTADLQRLHMCPS